MPESMHVRVCLNYENNGCISNVQEGKKTLKLNGNKAAVEHL